YYITTQVANEFEVLLKLPEEELKNKINPRIAEGIIKVRKGEVDIFPGYDGEYGRINIRWAKENDLGKDQTALNKQLELF
ncbi:MAG: endonuclease Q family protein, partial [Endomicrobia bacterium]|nr:endonuclease Q family protein [Endomicrobiia bacterium]